MVEGVETAKQAAFLGDADGDQAQGYYFFGRPVPASEVSASILADFRRRFRTSTTAQDAKLRLVKASAER